MVRFFRRFHIKSFWAAFCACICLCYCIPYLAGIAFASDLDAPEDLVLESTEQDTSAEIEAGHGQDPVQISVEVNIPEDTQGFDPNNIVSVDVVRSTNPVTPNDATGLKKIILQLIGTYDMVTSEYTYTSNNGYTNKQITTEPDYAWMISAAIFLVVLYCIFRLFGGVISGR